jgi:prepilin-type N-terminal cleavage/methylation domain-containing protein
MIRRKAAFTLVELMIAMAIVMVVLYAAINFFIVSVRQYKVQTKITETNVEGILGLELFRQDLESLGFGLPWNGLVAYTERPGIADLAALEDTPDAPRAVLSLDDPTFPGNFNNSDYLVIKSARVGMSDAAGKWTTLTQANIKRSWTPSTENLTGSDYVIVLAVGSTESNRRSLVTSGTYYTPYTNAGTAGFVPVEPYSANIVYGIDNVQPVRPFNRAEYYIDNSAVPQRCAPNTGVLVKAVVAHDGTGTTPTLLPLLDCVADMQLVYGLDSDADGVVNNWTPTLDTLGTPHTAADIRRQLVELHVHILAQEGQRDDSYAYPYDNVTVGSESAGRSFVFTSYGFIPSGNVANNFKHYRWKVYNITVNPKNLAQ